MNTPMTETRLSRQEGPWTRVMDRGMDRGVDEGMDEGIDKGSSTPRASLRPVDLDPDFFEPAMKVTR